MSKFKVGDRVRVSASGDVGRVESVVTRYVFPEYRLVNDNGDPIVGRYGRFQDLQLEHVALVGAEQVERPGFSPRDGRPVWTQECLDCLTGADLGVATDLIAHVHPDCPVHGRVGNPSAWVDVPDWDEPDVLDRAGREAAGSADNSQPEFTSPPEVWWSPTVGLIERVYNGSPDDLYENHGPNGPDLLTRLPDDVIELVRATSEGWEWLDDMYRKDGAADTVVRAWRKRIEPARANRVEHMVRLLIGTELADALDALTCVGEEARAAAFARRTRGADHA